MPSALRGRVAERARATIALAHALTRQERLPQAPQRADDAVALARRSRRPELIALALLRQATAGFLSNPEVAAAQADEAARRFEASGDLAHQGPALRVLGAVRMSQRDVPEHRAVLERAIELARQAGDRGGESRAINSLFSNDPDLALRCTAPCREPSCWPAGWGRPGAPACRESAGRRTTSPGRYGSTSSSGR